MPLQIPHPNTPLHLYRHLLREASYLPPLCRPWIASRIQTRYRDCQHTNDPKSHVKEAHHYLRYLRSANAGHVDRLLHLCYLATGRVGKRRRQLATLFLSKRPPENTASLESDVPSNDRPSKGSSKTPAPTLGKKSSPEAAEEGREPDWLDNWAVDRLHAVAASQVEHQGGDWPQAMRRSYDPKRALPTENAFGRPFPKKVARNKLKRHYASVLKQLLPPLPQGEWDRLRDLANGAEGTENEMTTPPRRVVARPTLKEPRDKDPEDWDWDWDWVQYVTKPVRAVERKNSRKMKSLTGEPDQDPRGQGRPIGVRLMRSRKIRRGIYGRVFELANTMTQNPRSGKWTVTWGSSERKLSKPTATDLGIFQGVDDSGKLVAPA
ncbi:hypothetical protein DL770_007194 [Monosporascus sp. CRB-9-2]|nr:hypothetical protein DL770_007194 [Monosporascus sp. CRB-9-2]